MARYTPEQYQRKLKKWARNTPQAVVAGLKKGTEIIRTEAVVQHLSGPKMPKGVGNKMNATLARRTGLLAGSVRTKVKVASNRISGAVGTNVKYAHNHEKGTTVPERPFLAPSLEKKRKDALEAILSALMAEYRAAG